MPAAPAVDDALYFHDAAEFRQWLERNHATESEAWLVFYRKQTGKQELDWKQAVVEALRYGWIDGQLKGVDEERRVQRFTPRRPKSKWSKVNKATAERLIAEGTMAPAGLAAVEAGKASGEWDRAYKVAPPVPVPEDVKAAVSADPEVKKNFRFFSRSALEKSLAWIGEVEGDARAARIEFIVEHARGSRRTPVFSAFGDGD